MRPEVQTSLDSDLVLNRLFRFRYLNTCSLALVRGNGSDRLDRFLCPTSNPERSRCLTVSDNTCQTASRGLARSLKPVFTRGEVLATVDSLMGLAVGLRCGGNV